MKKIATVLQLILTNHEQIKQVVLEEAQHYYFSYNNSVWSIKKIGLQEIELQLFISNTSNVDEIIELVDTDEVKFVIYKQNDLDETCEGALSELYSAVKEKVFGVNELLEQIILEATAVAV